MYIDENHLEDNSQKDNKFEEFVDKAYEEINKDITKLLFEMRKEKQNRINHNDKFNQNFYNNINENQKIFNNLTPNINNSSIKAKMNNNYIQSNLLTKNQFINYNNNELTKFNNNYPTKIPISNSQFYNNNIIYINNNNNENADNKPYQSFFERRGLDLFYKEDPDNIIKINNIIRNKDKRTTLIIRNIPNKYNISLLLIELNEKFKNQFDMIYLPQDKIKDSNLGFGFINFSNPLNLILFYDKFMGKKWNFFNSPKRCFLAYSNFQGKNELINYMLKKLGIRDFNHTNNSIILNEKIRKSLYINNIINIKAPIEIPLKYRIKFENYQPYCLCYKKDNKIFVVESFKK